MNLASMRDVDHNDPIGGLGPRVTPAPTPAPAPVPIGNGIVRAPDGKLSTDLPDPTVTPTLPSDDDYPPVAAPAELPPDRCAREPLKVGDRVRRLKPSPAGTFPAGYVHIVVDTCAAAVLLEHDSDVLWSNEGITWERV